MIYFGFRISWPWFKEIDSKDYFFKYWSLSKNKTLELQFSRGGDSLIGFNFDASTRCDHAGFTLEFKLFRRFIYICFHDNRHWNYEENRYVNYDNPEEVEKYW